MAFEGFRRAFSQEPLGAMSPEEVERRRRMVDALYAPAEVVTSGWGVLNEGLKGIFGGLEDRRLTKAEREGRAGATASMDRILAAFGGGAPSAGGLGGGSTTPYSPPAGGANYRDAIASIESGGRYDAVGPTNARLGRPLGKYQVMEANVGPWSEQVLGRRVTPEEFLASPEIQDAIFDGIFGGYVSQYGPEGAAQAWFGGPGAVGQTGRQDVLGTSVGEYVQRFMQGVGGGAAAPQQMAQAGGNVSPVGMQQIMATLQNPWLDESQRSVLGALLTQAMTPPDPTAGLVTAGGQIYNANTGQWMTPPAAPEPVQYDSVSGPNGGLYAFDPTTGTYRQGVEGQPDTDADIAEFTQAQQAGLIPPDMSYQDFLALKRAPGTTINLPGAPNIGSIPQGYAAKQDPETGEWTMAPIPGGPQDTTAQDAASGAQRERTADIVTQDIDRALSIIDQGTTFTTGIGGAALGGLPGTPAFNLNALIDTIKANVGFDKLQAMRDASPTGGALGQVSEFENRLLQATIGNLAISQNPQQLRDNLNRVYNVYLDIVHGPGQGPTRRPLSFETPEELQPSISSVMNPVPMAGPPARSVQSQPVTAPMGAPQGFVAPPGVAAPPAAPAPPLQPPAAPPSAPTAVYEFDPVTGTMRLVQ